MFYSILLVLLALVAFGMLAHRGKKQLERLSLAKRSRPRVLESVLARIQQRVHYNNEIRKHADAQPANPKAAVAILNQMEAAGVEASLVSYNYLLKAYVRGIPAQVKEALELLDRMESAGLSADQFSYNTCLAACAQQGLPEIAQSLLDRMSAKNIEHNAFSFNSLINANATVEPTRVDEAVKTLDVMKKLGLEPDEVSFSLIIKAYGNAETASLETVQELIDQMSELEIPAGPVFFNAAFRAIAVSEKCDWGKWLEMLALHDIEADESMYHRAIRANTVASRPRPESAEKVLKHMIAAGLSPDTVAYTMVISAYSDRGDYNAAYRLYQEMTDQGVEHSPVTITCVLKSIPRSMNPAAMVKKAESLVAQMKDSGTELNTNVYNCLLNCHASAKPHVHIQRVQEILNEMEAAGFELDAVTFSTCTTAFSNAKPARPDLAEQMIRRAQSLGIEPDVVMYSSLITAYANCIPAQTDKARAILAEMESVGVEPNTVSYTAVINAYANSSPARPQEAEQLIQVMKQKQVPLSTITFNTTIMAYANARPPQPDQAEEVLKTMLKHDIKPDLVTYSSLVNAFGKAGRADDAERMINEMIDLGIKPNTITFTALIGAYANSQPARPQEAENVLKRMVERGVPPNEVSYAVVLKAYSSTTPSRPKDCLRVLHGMQVDSTGLQPDTVIYNTVFRALRNAGQPAFGDALKLYDSMLAVGQQPNDVTFNTLFHIASHDPTQSAQEKALAIFNTVPLKMRDAYTYPAVLHILANLGSGRKKKWEEEAFKIFGEARTNLAHWPNEHVFKAALRACPRERKQLHAMWEADARINRNCHVYPKHLHQRPVGDAQDKFDSRSVARQRRCPREGWAALPNRVISTN